MSFVHGFGSFQEYAIHLVDGMELSDEFAFVKVVTKEWSTEIVVAAKTIWESNERPANLRGLWDRRDALARFLVACDVAKVVDHV